MADTSVKNYNAFDLFKWIASFFVIAIHTKFLTTYITPETGPVPYYAVNLTYVIFHCAVPYFFMMSTFFMAKKIDWEHDSDGNFRLIENNAVRIFHMYLLWVILYLPLTFMLSSEYGFRGEQLAWETVFTIFLGGGAAAMHLWFLLSLFLSLLLLLFICGRSVKRFRIMIVVSVLLFAVRAFAYMRPLPAVEDPLWQFLTAPFCWEIFEGPFFCTIGILISRYEEQIRKYCNVWVKLAACVILIVIHTFTRNYVVEMLFTISVTLLLFSVQIQGNPKTFRFLRKLSMYVYLIHLWVKFVIQKATGLPDGTLLFIAVAVACNLIGVLMVVVNDRRARKKA